MIIWYSITFSDEVGDVMVGISEKAVVLTDRIGSNVTIEEFSIIRPGVTIGNNVHIHPYVVIENGVTIGDNSELFPNTYIGKKPKGAGALAREPFYEEFVVIGSDCCLGPNAVIYYDVTIGENTLIGDGASIREKCRVGSYCIISRYVTMNYETIVGDRTKIMDSTHITGRCCVGNNVFIGMLVSTANDNSLGKDGYVECNINGPLISDEATVGQGAVIFPGVKIGRGAVVGANAVVTKDVPDYAVTMGMPAKVVRYIEKKTYTNDNS